MMNKRKLPKFNRYMGVAAKRSHADKWRKPRGQNSKKRLHIRKAGKLPRIGYGQPKLIRGLHPCGKYTVVVNNIHELESIGDRAAYIGRTVGKKKKVEILQKAKELGVKILNGE